MSQGKQIVPVYLNHVYVNLDEESHEAICASPFIQKEYAPFWQKTVKSEASGTYSATFLGGENSYIELFGNNSNEGFCGVSFGVEQVGLSNQVCEQINTAFGADIAPQLNQFIDGEQQIPWYYFIDPPIPALRDSALYTWIMEYHPDIFHHRSITWSDPTKLTRKAYLSAERSLLPSAWMKDVVALTVQLKPAAVSAFATLLRAFRYDETQEPGATLFCGPGISIRLIAGEMATKYSIREIKTSLTRMIDQPMEFNFGSNANLRLIEDTAVWTFGS